MKKIILALFALSSIAALAEAPQNHIYGKFGVDLYDNYSKVTYEDDNLKDDYDDSYWSKSNKGRGVGIFLEATRDVLPNTELGLGIGYIHRGDGKVESERTVIYKYTESWNTPRYKTIPLYLVAKYNFDVNSTWRPYVKVDFGYAMNRKNKNIVVNYVPDTPDSEDPIENHAINTKVKNGIYTGIGVGAEYNNFLAELSYHLTTAKIHLSGIDEEDNTPWNIKKKYNNHAVRLSLGYKFDF